MLQSRAVVPNCFKVEQLSPSALKTVGTTVLQKNGWDNRSTNKRLGQPFYKQTVGTTVLQLGQIAVFEQQQGQEHRQHDI